MAKELPYFKFEPNQWENGNIQMLSREDKGLFIDLCSMYWSRLGDVPLKLAIQKLCGGNARAFDLLCEENIIQVVDNNIFIKFLSEQINTFENTSEQNSRNALDGWEKRRKQKKIDADASALIPQSESYAIREEKSKEEKIIKDKIKESLSDFSNPANKSNIDFDKLVLFFNNNRGNMPMVKSITTGRKNALKSILKENTKEDLMAVIIKSKESEFIQGITSKWIGNFDWITKKSNFIKILEGNYINNQQKPQTNGTATFAKNR